MSYKKIFVALAIVPQIAATASALFDTVKKIDDDPALRAVFEEAKKNIRAAETLHTIRVQVAVLKSLIKQLV